MSFGIPVRNGLSISLLSTTSLSSGRGLRPSLALNFLSGTLDSRIDFTRTSSATYVDATGKIVSTPASRNLLTFTQEFDNAGWTKTNATAYPFDPATAVRGPELVTNGDFSGGTTGWTLGTGWSVSGGAAVSTGLNAFSGITQTISTTAGRWYQIQFTMTRTSGSLLVRLGGGTNVANISASGTYVLYAVAEGAGITFLQNAAGFEFAGSIDNISVKELSSGLIAAPDGTLTADKAVATATTSFAGVSQFATITIGATYTFSAYAKMAEWRYVTLSPNGSADYAVFDLQNGSVAVKGAATTASIQSVGNGWYRCTLSYAEPSAASRSFAIFPNNTGTFTSQTGDGTSGIFIWGAQLEAGSTATDYTRNNGGVYPPRFDYDPVTLAPKGLLVEEQRTNLLLRSEAFDNAAWMKSRASIVANSATAPDGLSTAGTIIPDTASGYHHVVQNPTVSASTVYTVSCYFKNAGYRYAFIYSNDVSKGSIFDLQTLSVTGVILNAPTSSSITDVGNGWRRCSITITSATTSSQIWFGASSSGTNAVFVGDGTSGIYIWGAQLEAGAFATSYIPTVASQVTRTADVATITGANFSQWYNQSEGTVVSSFSSVIPTSSSQGIWAISDGTNSERWFAFCTNNTIRHFMVDGGVTQASIDVGTYSPNTVFKSAMAIRLNSAQASVNGALGVEDTSATIPTVDRMDIGNRIGAAFLNGWIRSLQYYPYRLSDSQLQALTA